MSKDPYAPCPCGSGKKLKWCCQPLEGDMRRVEQLIAKEQPAAAATALQRLAGKWPDNPWVLITQAKLFWRGNRAQEAEGIVLRLLELYPKHPTGLVMRAMTLIDSEGVTEALDAVQEAIFVGGEQSTEEMGQLALATGLALESDGEILAARKYLRLAQALHPGSEEVEEFLRQADANASGLPLVREDYQLKEAGEVASERQEDIDEAARLSERGAWREAAKRYEQLTESLPECKELWYNLALCRAWHADDGAVDALRRYVAMESSVDDAVEAEVLAQWLDEQPWGARLDVVQVCYPVSDPGRLTDALDSDERFHKLEIEPPESDQDQQQERPQSAYLLLDRPAGEWRDGLTPEEIAVNRGAAELYAPDGDRRDYRLEVEFVADGDLDETRGALEQLAGNSIGPAETPETLPGGGGEEHPIQLRWQFPDNTSRQECRRLTNETRANFVREVWANRPLARLDGLSPLEASQDQKYRTTLSATLLLIEELFFWDALASPMQTLREQLGLPPTEPLDAADVDIGRLPLARFGRLPAAQLDDDRLVAAFRRAERFGVLPALGRLGDELLRRDHLSARIDLGMVCAELSSAANTLFDTEAALAYNARGRELDKQYDRDLCAFWDLQEFPLQLIVPDNQEVAEPLLRHILEQHGKDPYVQRTLGQILDRFGLIPREGEAVEPKPEPSIVVPGGEDAGRIWTPEQQEPQATPKIWTPGDA